MYIQLGSNTFCRSFSNRYGSTVALLYVRQHNLLTGYEYVSISLVYLWQYNKLTSLK
jgi:hypothetical protein